MRDTAEKLDEIASAPPPTQPQIVNTPIKNFRVGEKYYFNGCEFTLRKITARDFIMRPTNGMRRGKQK